MGPKREERQELNQGVEGGLGGVVVESALSYV